MAKAKVRLKEEDIQEGKVYTDGKTAGVRVLRKFEKYGCPMVKIETVVGKRFWNSEWTMGSLLSWAVEEVEMPKPIELPAGLLDKPSEVAADEVASN